MKHRRQFCAALPCIAAGATPFRCGWIHLYGWPGWLWPILRTEWASRRTVYPEVDLRQYPAHLHIGILPVWRRRGIGMALRA